MVRRRLPLLLRRDRPLQGESLPSFVARLAQLNYYDPITIIDRLLYQGPEKDRLDWPSKGETYEKLFELTWIDPYRLHKATAHYFAETLTPLGMTVQLLHVPGGAKLTVITPKIAREQLRPAHAVQFCPLCLKQSPYHRVAWIPIAAAACITHKRMLVDRCPGCQRRVSIRAIVEHCRCRQCGADFREAHSSWLGKDAFGLLSQRFVRWCLRLGRAPVDSLPHRLSQKNSQAMFYLIAGLVDSIRLLGSDWDYVYQPITRLPLDPFGRIRGRPSPDQSYRLHATAFKALVKWPQGFHEFLYAYRLRGDERIRASMFEDLGRLYARWLSDRWSDPVFNFVQEAFSHYLVDTYVTPCPSARQDGQAGPALSRTLAFIKPSTAARLLGVSARTIKRLTDAGFLIKYTAEQGNPRRYGSVRQDEVLTLRLRWEGSVSLEEATKWLGLTRSLVLDLVKAGLLTANRSLDLNESDQLTFSKENLDRCYCQLTGRVKSSWKAYSSLVEMSRLLSTFGLRVVDIFKLVADGKLEAWSLAESPPLAALTFDDLDVEALLKGPDLGRKLIDSEEAARQLGVESGTLLSWTVAGYISPVLRYAFQDYFDPSELDGFLADCIPSQAAARIWGVEVEDVESWCWGWDWGVEAVKGTSVNGHPLYLFRREDVERLQAEFSESS